MKKVMIVDDDQTMASLLETLLKLDGYEVTRAGSAHTFLGQVESEAPDLVLLDVFLSDRESYDLVKELRSHEDASVAQLPVIMTSGMELSSKCRDAGANDFLLKPYDPEQLLQVIHINLNSG